MKNYAYFLLLMVVPLLAPAQSAEHILDSLRRELGKTKVDTARMWIFYELAKYQSFQTPDSAFWYTRQGLQLARKTNHQKGEMEGKGWLAYLFSERDIPQSMRLRLEVLQQAQQANDRAHISFTYVQLGILQIYLENYRQAIVYYKRAKTLAVEDKDKQNQAGLSTELGGAYWLLHQPDSARYYLTLAAQEDPVIKQQPGYIYYWGRLEGDYNPTKANAYFRQSIQIAKAQQFLRGLGYIYRWYSEFLWKQHQPDSSILMAKAGLQAGQTVANFRNILLNSRLLTTYYQALGRPDSAYKYQSIMVAVRDNLFSQQKVNQIQSTFIEEQQRTQLLEEEKSRFESRVKIYSLLGIVAVLMLMAGVSYRNNRQKQKTNEQLQTLNQAVQQQKEEIEAQRDYLEETLTELKSTQDQLIQKEKLASLGELTAGIAHEIQNPLNFVNNFAEVSTELVDELKQGPFQQLPDSEKEYAKEILGDLTSNLQKINHHGGRASSIVKGMLEHSRTSSGEKQPTNLNGLADEYLKIAYHGQRAKEKSFNCELVTDFDPDLGQADVIPQDMGRVLLNLYNNAFYAVQARQNSGVLDYQPTVRVSTKQVSKGVEISVSDNGTGIPKSAKDKIFQPFFTTKPTGEGTGLGLSLSYDIVTKGHGGTFDVESVEGEGTIVIVTLPFANSLTFKENPSLTA